MGGAAAGAGVSALLGGERAVAHAEFVAIVDEWCAGQHQQCGIGKLAFSLGQSLCGAERVVIAGDEIESPDSPLLDRHIVRHGLNVKEFNLGKNVTSVEEE